MSAEYGAKGCRCFRDEVDVSRDGRVERIPGRWLPNAACPHHGLLADFTERMETGQYTVISKPVTIEPRNDWPCDEGEDLRTGSAYTQAPGCQPSDCCGDPAAHRWTRWGEYVEPQPTTTEEERQRGLRAAVRRARAWFRRRYHLPRLDEHGYCTRCD